MIQIMIITVLQFSILLFLFCYYFFFLTSTYAAMNHLLYCLNNNKNNDHKTDHKHNNNFSDNFDITSKILVLVKKN